MGYCLFCFNFYSILKKIDFNFQLNYYCIKTSKMNTETIKQLKDKYRVFLNTTQGSEMLHEAVEIKRAWVISQQELRIQYGDFTGTTQNSADVKKQLLPRPIQDRMQLVKITPIGINNICHKNAEILSGDGFCARIGYNMFACPCGKRLSFELHSLNKKDGKLYDFTRDFNDETEKWFLEIDTDTNPHSFVSVWGKNSKHIDLGCRCGICWENVRQTDMMHIDMLTKMIVNMERMMILG